MKKPILAFLAGSALLFALHATVVAVRGAASGPVPVTAPDGALTLGAYLWLGCAHILFGFDHLLFIAGLALVVRGPAKLLGSVTAFTLGHSLTLALATLGVFALPGAPVEAAIALSVLFLAWEGGALHRGRPASGAPWIAAAVFGLLHGFGLAGSLAATGLPHGREAASLLSFNAGVEISQLLVVSAIFGCTAAVRRLRFAVPRWVAATPACAVGGLATFWLVERCAGF